MKKLIIITAVILAAVSCNMVHKTVSVSGGATMDNLLGKTDYTDFDLTGMACLDSGATAAIKFHTEKGSDCGYEVLFHNGPIDGTRKTGSLVSVRDLYRSLAEDGEWFPFEIAVRGKNVAVKIKDMDVVCYTEPEEPYRVEKYAGRVLGSGKFRLISYDGKASFKDLSVSVPEEGSKNPCDTMPPIDEQTDHIIRLQQADFPVIDWHVHCKGGFTIDMARACSMNYGINYGVGPNAYGPMQPGEGGYGTMYMNDDDLGEYFETVKDLPFLRGVQGEGRKWSYSFSNELLSKFDYLYTDAMTIVDHKGRLTRTYRAEEVHMDIPKEQYMDVIVDQMVKILTNEPADILANAFYIPEVLSGNTDGSGTTFTGRDGNRYVPADQGETYDYYWTDERVNKVLDVMKENRIALEISARYKIPSKHIIEMAKDKGLKFTFGTNNMGGGFGKLEYSIKMAQECGLTPEDMWYPVMSTRAARMEALQSKESE